MVNSQDPVESIYCDWEFATLPNLTIGEWARSKKKELSRECVVPRGRRKKDGGSWE